MFGHGFADVDGVVDDGLGRVHGVHINDDLFGLLVGLGAIDQFELFLDLFRHGL